MTDKDAPINATDWQRWAICPGCGEGFRPAFGRVFFLPFEVCPKCGEPKGSWEIRTRRYVFTGRFFRPWTWGTGYFEDRETGRL